MRGTVWCVDRPFSIRNSTGSIAVLMWRTPVEVRLGVDRLHTKNWHLSLAKGMAASPTNLHRTMCTWCAGNFTRKHTRLAQQGGKRGGDLSLCSHKTNQQNPVLHFPPIDYCLDYCLDYCFPLCDFPCRICWIFFVPKKP